MSHVKRDDVTYNRVTPFKIVWLIFCTKKCCGTNPIDVSPDVHIEVSHPSAHGGQTDLHDLKGSELGHKFRTDSFLNFLRTG
jgi:hypothetical protein